MVDRILPLGKLIVNPDQLLDKTPVAEQLRAPPMKQWQVSRSRVTSGPSPNSGFEWATMRQAAALAAKQS